MNKRKGHPVSLLSGLVLILLWFFASLAIGSQIILPSPGIVIKDLLRLLTSSDFLKNAGTTILRALESFVLITFAGTVTGILAGKHLTVERILSPLVTVFKATPVMSVILIAFIWFRTGAVPVFSAFLMAFPVMFVQTVSGYRNLDPKLEEMCSVYGISGKERLKQFVLPSMEPYLITGARQTLSMIWKVIIAAEVITVPRNGIGRAMQLAQIHLETSEIFAWTLVTVFLTALGDYAFDKLLANLKQRRVGNDN